MAIPCSRSWCFCDYKMAQNEKNEKEMSRSRWTSWIVLQSFCVVLLYLLLKILSSLAHIKFVCTNECLRFDKNPITFAPTEQQQRKRNILWNVLERHLGKTVKMHEMQKVNREKSALVRSLAIGFKIYYTFPHWRTASAHSRPNCNLGKFLVFNEFSGHSNLFATYCTSTQSLSILVLAFQRNYLKMKHSDCSQVPISFDWMNLWLSLDKTEMIQSIFFSC